MNAKEVCDLANSKSKHEIFFEMLFESLKNGAEIGLSKIQYEDDLHHDWVYKHHYVHMNDEQKKYLEELGYKITKEESTRDYRDSKYIDTEVPFMFFFKRKETKKEYYTRLIKYYSVTIEACCEQK